MSEHGIPPLLEQLLERIDDQLTGREALELEYKKAAGGLPKNLWETVSAFANSSGGWIVLGIDDEAIPVAIEGVPHAQDVLQTFFNQMRNQQKISAEVCGAADAAIERLDGNDVIVIRIPAAPRKQRPIYIDGNPYRGTFIRRHSGDFRCTKPEVDRMMRDASDASADETILPKFGWDDLDRETFRRYRQRFLNARPDHEWTGLSDDEFLRNLGGYRRDRDLGVEGITVATLLMFGRAASIREWRGRHMFDFRQLPGDLLTAADWDDRFVWEGNLYGAFETMSPRLTSGLPTPFRLEGGMRVDDTPVHRAVREALVNLLIHADYAETASSLVFRSPEGFFFRNPGNSRVPFEELTFGRHSDPRNPTLVFMFRLVNLAEEAGSGILRIFSTWRSLGYTRPSIDAGADRYEFTLQLRHVHLFTEEDRAWLSAFGEPWDEPEQLAMLAALHEGDVDNARLRSLTGLHPADATKVLRSLRDRGYLTMSGWGRGASYQLGHKARALNLVSTATNSATSGASSATSDDGSATCEANSATSEVRSAPTPETLETSPTPPGERDEAERRMRLESIAEQVRGRPWIPADRLSATIVELCTVQPLSLRELMILLERSSQRLRPIITVLIESGRIQPLYPQRRHPNQRYTVPSNETTAS